MDYKDNELNKIIKAQATVRGWIARKRYKKMKKNIIKLQAIVRAWLVAKKMVLLGK